MPFKAICHVSMFQNHRNLLGRELHVIHLLPFSELYLVNISSEDDVLLFVCHFRNLVWIFLDAELKQMAFGGQEITDFDNSVCKPAGGLRRRRGHAGKWA